MTKRDTPVSSPKSEISSDEGDELFIDDSDEGDDSFYFEDEGDSSPTDEESDVIIVPKSKKTAFSSDSEVVEPSRKEKTTKNIISSSPSVEKKKISNKKSPKKILSSDSEEEKTKKTGGKKSPKKILSSDSEEEKTKKTGGKKSPKKILSSDSEEEKEVKKKSKKKTGTPKEDNWETLIARDSNEREDIFKSRKIITGIVSKTVLGSGNKKEKSTAEEAITIGRQINNKFWFGLTYDPRLEDLISEYIEVAPELADLSQVKKSKKTEEPKKSPRIIVSSYDETKATPEEIKEDINKVVEEEANEMARAFVQEEQGGDRTDATENPETLQPVENMDPNKDIIF